MSVREFPLQTPPSPCSPRAIRLAAFPRFPSPVESLQLSSFFLTRNSVVLQKRRCVTRKGEAACRTRPARWGFLLRDAICSREA